MNNYKTEDKRGSLMKYQRYLPLLALFWLFSAWLPAQELIVTASKDDWEEINFEFNSHILTDGFPSLLRMAEVLQQHPDYRVRIEGHADFIGSRNYNQRLGERRAQAVRDFLLKYGARDNQVTTASLGETQPKLEARGPRSREARFINRRVMLTLTDGSGRVIAAGGISDILPLIKDLMAAQQKCCDEILKRLDRLDKLDDIANLLQKLAGENDTLRKELADLRKAHSDLDTYVKGLPKPLTEQQTAQIVDVRTAEQIERARMPRYSIVNLNVGADGNGDLTFTGRGRLFMPFKEQLAVQLQGEYMYHRDRQEGQADIGLVNRFASRAQAGIFASFKNVRFSGNDPATNPFATQFTAGDMRGSGTLGQASATLDYLFSRGRFGVFGSKAFLNDSVINRVALSRNLFTEYYLSAIDQFGVSTLVGMYGDSYLEGNFGYLKSKGNADRPGGTLRFVFPISERFAFTLEGGLNETLLSRDNNGRVVAGFQFGNFMRPKDYLEGYNGVQHAVPADIPRVRYEVLTRRVRTGNDAPVAIAGAGQIGVQAGPVTLDGSSSYDPDGDPITFRWEQISGPSVSLSGMNQAVATFTAAEGQSYAFRLTVRDDKGAQGIDRATVTTTEVSRIQIVRFQASPDRIRQGEQSTIDWQVLNAQTVTITEIGDVEANGTRSVSPNQTTTYRLTARNRGGEVTATTTVVVEQLPPAQFTTCTVSPMNIAVGESATITWATANADDVSISGIGSVGLSGSQVVSPTADTSYTLTATNARGPVTCTVSVRVSEQVSGPRVIAFTANPTQIQSGQSSTLSWNVENATSVEINNGVGTVQATGTTSVSPTQTTAYTLTARNQAGEVTATATVTVGGEPGGPTISACAATPANSPSPGAAVQIAYATTNATSVTFSPAVSGAGLQGPVTVNPTATTTYTITATGAGNQTATCSVTVNVPVGPEPPDAIITGPSVVDTIQRLLTLDGSASTDPAGGALTYIWEPLGTGAAILDQGQPMARVQLGGPFGDYIIRLTVRNAAGQEDSTTVTVRFKSTTVF
jgi:hypothetical protein